MTASTEAAPVLQLQLLGGARLQHGAFSVDLPDAAAGYLLAVLGARGDWVAREELAVLFWPEADSKSAQRNLRVTLNRLRDKLAEWGVAPALASERSRLCWQPGSDLCRARAARDAGDWSGAATLLSGGFVPSLGFRGFPVLAEWAATERRGLLAWAREAVLRCAATAPPAQAEQLAARQLEQDPSDEALLRVRLQALATLGRHEDVARAWAAFDTRLRADLGIGASRALADWVASLGSSPGGGSNAGVGAGDDPMIGRDAEEAQARELLARSRVLTVTGLGGVGKSRLALALSNASPAALWLPLVDASTVAELPHRVLHALNPAAPATRNAAAQAGDLLAQRVRLLVLDNVEQLLGERAALHALIDTWLQAAPGLQLLLTSRVALAHPAEAQLLLRTLALPLADTQGPDQPHRRPDGRTEHRTLAAPAVQVLVAAARRARPGFDPREHTDALARIAHQVGGLPLALRLAAQWLRLLSPADVSAALQRSVGALDDGNAGLQATLKRSWDLLDPGAQTALARLSVFASRFTAAEAGQAGAADLPAMARLADHGLLEAEADTAPERAVRWHLHPLVRAYAAEQLAASGDAGRAAHEGHARAVQRRLGQWANWRTVDQKAALQDLAEALPETLAAWQWALAAGRADFIAACAPVLLHYFEKSGRRTEGIALYAAAQANFDTEARTDLAALAALQRGRALLLYRDSRYGEAVDWAQRALGAARSLGHDEGIKGNLNTLALAQWMLGQLEAAEAAIREACALATAGGDQAGLATFSGNLALLQKRRGHYAQALATWQQTLAAHREVGNWSSATTTLQNLGNLLRLMGRPEEAVTVLEESLRLCETHGFASSRAFGLINLARVHLVAGRLDTAEALATQTLLEVGRAGERMLEAATLLVLADLALRTGRLGVAAERLLRALRLAHALNDPANLLEALCGYARWRLAHGDSETAAAVVATVRVHPSLHGELRDELAQPPLSGLPEGPAVNLQVMVEQAAAALARDTADSPG